MSDATAEQVMVSRLRDTIALDHGKVRQIFDVINCPGLTVVCESQYIGDDFVPLSQIYELAGGEQFDSPSEALLAWDRHQTDLELMDTLGHALQRHRFGLMRPLWQDRKPKDKAIFLGAARHFRTLLNSLGLDIVRIDQEQGR